MLYSGHPLRFNTTCVPLKDFAELINQNTCLSEKRESLAYSGVIAFAPSFKMTVISSDASSANKKVTVHQKKATGVQKKIPAPMLYRTQVCLPIFG